MGQSVSGAGSSISGIAKGTTTSIGGILKLLFWVKLRWTLTVILLFVSLFSAGTESLKQKNIAPLVFDVGGQLVSADENLYWYLKEIEANNWRFQSEGIESYEEGSWFRSFKSLLAKINPVVQLISTMWFVYIVTYVLYWIFHKFNTSAVFFNILIAVIIVILLQSMYGSVMLYLNYKCDSSNLDKCLNQDEKYKNALFALTPAKGITFFVVNILNENLINAFKEEAVPIVKYLTKVAGSPLPQGGG